MIESAETEQASVVFLGHSSFRMQIGATPVPFRNEMAIPARGSENQTERLYGSNLGTALEPDLAPVPVPLPSRTRLVGLCLAGVAIGILVTSIVDRGLLRRGSERSPDAQQTAQSTERAPELPAPSPTRSAGSAQPLAAAEPAAVAAKPPASAAIVKPVRPARVRAVRTPRTRGPSPGLPPASPGAKAVTPAPAAKWVDPFAG